MLGLFKCIEIRSALDIQGEINVTDNDISQFFSIDQLSLVMILLVLSIGSIVARFAYRYLDGDSRFRQFYALLVSLIFSLCLMVCIDNIWIFLLSWGVSNALLICLMVHNSSWKQALASGVYTSRTYALGFACLSLGCALLVHLTGQTSIDLIVASAQPSYLLYVALALLILAAMTQSAIWPFHKWLISSLNSPTPVSAIMHAGLVNGGGYLLAHFAGLYFQTPIFLKLIFGVGLVSAVLGTFWKLLQADVKRMLACSTIGQMGYMMVQCGVGLFPAAITHLFCHGFYKAYLFLSSGQGGKEKRVDLNYPPTFWSFISSMACGIFGVYGFLLTKSNGALHFDTRLFLYTIVWIMSTQFVLLILRKNIFIRFPLGMISAFVLGYFYGQSVLLIGHALTPMQIECPQTMSLIHWIGLGLLFFSWMGMLFGQYLLQCGPLKNLLERIYVLAHNASQPYPSTITASVKHDAPK